MNGDEDDLDADLGEPIALLAELSQEPRQGFVSRVRGSIERRRLGSHVSGLVWRGLPVVLIQMLTMVMALIPGSRKSAGPPISGKDQRPPPTA